MSEWIKALSSLIKDRCQKIPKGWKTMKEISEECGKSRSHTNHLLNELKAKGLVDTQTFVIQKGEHLRAIQYYRLKKTGKI